MKFDELDLGSNQYVTGIHENGGNSLIIDICAGIVESIPDEEREKRLAASNDPVERLYTSANAIRVDKSVIWRIVFDDYVAFQVLNESYDGAPEGPVYRNRKFRIFDASMYLDHVRCTALVKEVAELYSDGDPARHYGIWSLNHIVDVVSCKAPEISVIYKART